MTRRAGSADLPLYAPTAGPWSAMLLLFASLASGIALAHTPVPAPAPAPATWAQVQALPKPPAGKRIAYGPGARQFGELRLPNGRGPHPVAILLHGGCWQSMFNLDYLAPLADRLAREGVATWNLEYRGIGDVGGGWPGTFEDAAAGAAKLRVIAKANSLDLNRVVLAGHSAGGQLALWLAGPTYKKDLAPLHAHARVKVRGVVGLAAIADMRDYGRGLGDCSQSVAQVLGGSPEKQPRRYAATSPAERLPVGVPLRLFVGGADPIVTRKHQEGFVTKARKRRDKIELTVIEGAGHFDPVMPDAPASRTVQQAIHRLLGSRMPATQVAR